MGQAAAQVPVLMARVTVVAVLIPVFRVTKAIKAIRAVIINSLVRGINKSNLNIKLTQSN